MPPQSKWVEVMQIMRQPEYCALQVRLQAAKCMQTARHTIRKWIFGAARLPVQSDNQPAKHNTYSNILVRRLTHTLASPKRWGLGARLGSGMSAFMGPH